MKHVVYYSRERCRTSPPRFLAECCKTRLNQGSFVWLCFVFGIVFFSGLCLVFVVCLFLICLLSCIFRREPTWMVCWSCAHVLFTHSLTTHFSPSVEWLCLSPYLLWSSVTRPHLTAPRCQRLYSVSQKKSPPGTWYFSFFSQTVENFVDDFYPRDAMLAQVIVIATCPSVCHAPVLCQNEES